PLLEETAGVEAGPAGPEAARKLQEAYAAPIRPDLITERLAQSREAGVVVAGSLTPQNTQALYRTVVAAGVDLFVIRGTTVSAAPV
ncbi:GuaB3 family IMP dehydrogenase-related protein, partial [Micrococcus sp. SIMBA_131]